MIRQWRLTMVFSHPLFAGRSPWRAFTLVELLVVIAIIAGLASLLLPVMLKSVGNARSAACLNNQKQMGFAFQTYFSDYHDWFPEYAVTVAGYTRGYTWVTRLKPYFGLAYGKTGLPASQLLGASGVFVCPGDFAPVSVGGWSPSAATIYRDDFYISYAYYRRLYDVTQKAVRTRQPGQKLLTVDAHYFRFIYHTNDTANNGLYYSTGDPNVLENRHFIGANVLFVAGNVKWQALLPSVMLDMP